MNLYRTNMLYNSLESMIIAYKVIISFLIARIIIHVETNYNKSDFSLIVFHGSCFFLLQAHDLLWPFLTPKGSETIFKPFLKFGQVILKAIFIKNS
jgi:hypothetical protein